MDLPKSTVVNRFIPKEKFYNKTKLNSKIKQLFTDEIEKITWLNKIAPETLNIRAGDYGELQIFEIKLKISNISLAVLKHIDTYIPYPILFIINKSNASKAIISYKENVSKNQDNMKVESYFETGWEKQLNLELKGRSVDEIYKNYLFQIEPSLKNINRTDTKEAVASVKYKYSLQAQIDSINKKIKNELSDSKKQELARERFKLEQERNQP